MDVHNNWPPVPGVPPYPPIPQPKPALPIKRREVVLGASLLAFAIMTIHALFFGNLSLFFSLGVLGMLGSSLWYLLRSGYRPNFYQYGLLVLTGILAAGFSWTTDWVQILMLPILLLVPSLAFCLIAGHNRRPAGGFTSLLDSPRGLLFLGVGKLDQSARGIKTAFKSGSPLARTSGPLILGLVIALPVVLILVPLLMSADAAFEGLLDLLPEFRLREVIVPLLFGFPLGWVLFTRTVAMHHTPKPTPTAPAKQLLNPLTANTVLIAVCVVYAAYLVSQAAYFSGGFAGILPEEYTMADYARRGFFEMSWLAAINLTIISLAMGLLGGRAPVFTRICCLFIGLVTIFLVATASAKMFMYIRAYGLTHSRILTEAFMLWLAVTTIAVCVWLFLPKLPYLKIAMLLGLAVCACLMWTDVDTVVARYNVRAYQSGQLETVDMDHLYDLGYGVVPYLDELTRDSDPEIAEEATRMLERFHYDPEDRYLNFTYRKAVTILEIYQPPEQAEEATGNIP